MNMVNDGNPTVIYVSDANTLTFDETDVVASKEQYQNADRCVASIFDALEPDEPIRLSDGYFVLDDNLDLIQDWSII